MISGSSVIRKCIAWYDLRILCRKNVYRLVWFQDCCRKNIYSTIAWYDFRILCHKNPYCLPQLYDFRILCHKDVYAWYDFRILLQFCLLPSVPWARGVSPTGNFSPPPGGLDKWGNKWYKNTSSFIYKSIITKLEKWGIRIPQAWRPP